MSAPAFSTAFVRERAPAPPVLPPPPAPRWTARAPADEAAVTGLVGALGLPEVVCRLLAVRGITAPDDAKRYLRPRLAHLAPPDTFADLPRAVARIADAIDRGETIFLHGDYDVDGMASTALLTNVLRALGGRVVPFVPHRLTDGYDLGDAGVRAAQAAGARLVVTCDCGTSAHEPVARLMRAGIDVIVTDHHLPGHGLPPAYAVVNPRRPDCPSSDKDLAAVGVAYKLALALCAARGDSGNVAHHQLDLVALATIADVAPLRGENRVLVRAGLKLMADSPRPGVRALLRSSGLDGKPITAGRIGFVLAPRLNAAGRIADAKRGLALLLAQSEAEANVIARDLEEYNRHRQSLDRAVLDEALHQVAAQDVASARGFVLHGEGWHAGVIGIVASRVVEQTGRPTVMVAVEDGVGKGSGRSIPAFDLHAALGECAPLFERFGGHRAAAGLTMRAEHIPAFRERFADVAAARLTADDLVPELRIDAALPHEAVDDALEQLLQHFEPFGLGNAAPVFALEGVRLAAPARRVGKDGVRLALALPTRTVEALGWGMAGRLRELDPARPLDLAVRLERDTYGGRDQLQLRLLDWRAADGTFAVDG